MLSALYAIARLSVCPSVHHTGKSVKTHSITHAEVEVERLKLGL